jgi:hypothetical protein
MSVDASNSCPESVVLHQGNDSICTKLAVANPRLTRQKLWSFTGWGED